MALNTIGEPTQSYLLLTTSRSPDRVGIQDIPSVSLPCRALITVYLTESNREDPDTSFDWFKSYADLASHIRLLIPNKMARILMLGCGNSKFSEDVSKINLPARGIKAYGLLDVGGWLQKHCQH